MRRTLLAAVAGLALAPPAQAAQLTVTTTADAPGACVDGACPTLRSALETAAGTAETDTIQLPAGEYALLLGGLTVPGGVTLTGANARTTTVHGDAHAGTGESTIAHVTIGGVVNDGTLTLDHVHASGIANQGALTLTRSLVDGGAGVVNDGTLTASDGTITGTAGPGVSGTGTGTLTRMTIVRNGAPNVTGALRVRGSLLDRCGTGLTSDGGNLLPFGCGISGPGDLFGQDAKLGAALVNAGGESDVLRIAPGSAAAALAGACTGADQRDLARPQGSSCDAGSYELEVVQVTGPDGPTRSGNPAFSFTAAPGSTFRCKLDADEDPCASPADYPGLTDGEHTFTVQAFAGEEAVSDPVTRTFTVDTLAPDLQITSAPPALGRQNDVSFAFSAGDDATFECKLDSGDFAACTSPRAYEDLDDGSRTFTVRASDAAGNQTELSRPFAIDTAAPPTPVVTAPADNALLTATPVAFSGTIAEAGDAIVISEGGVTRGRVNSRGDGTWDTTVPATDGTHVYDVTAEDAAGNPSAPVTLTVRVDVNAPAPPDIAAPPHDSAQNSTTVTLSGSAEPNADVAIREGTEARGSAKAGANGAWTVAIANVPEGVHEYTATATDDAAHTSAPSAARRVTVDLTPPAAPEVSGGADGFTLGAEPGAELACSLDGSAFAPCASGVGFPGLAPGEHVLVVRATDAAGNASTTEHRFSVAAPAVVAATPTPTPVPAATAVATPSYRRTVVLRPQAGRTLIRRPGETAFSEIRARTAVAVGTTVDVKQGTVIVIAATPSSSETAKFSGGVFTASGTDLTLSAKLRCGRARRLTGDGAGAFRIRGRFAAATGRGAKWTVEDTCKRTRISVSRGVVAVRDNRRPKTVLIRSGRSYTARPKR